MAALPRNSSARSLKMIPIPELSADLHTRVQERRASSAPRYSDREATIRAFTLRDDGTMTETGRPAAINIDSRTSFRIRNDLCKTLLRFECPSVSNIIDYVDVFPGNETKVDLWPGSQRLTHIVTDAFTVMNQYGYAYNSEYTERQSAYQWPSVPSELLAHLPGEAIGGKVASESESEDRPLLHHPRPRRGLEQVVTDMTMELEASSSKADEPFASEGSSSWQMVEAATAIV